MSKKHKFSGKRSGPPPKSGPNPHIPPVKMRFGGGADMGAPDKAKDRAKSGYGNPGGGMAATGAPNQGMVSEIRRQNLEKAPDVASKPNFFGAIGTGAGMLRNVATFGASKLLDIPISGMRLAKNIIEPLKGTSRKNLNDYSPARSNNLLPPIGQGNQGDGLCPDGSNPPCQVVNAFKGKYFDEQKTMVKPKKKTGPIKGGKTPQIPGEDFMNYQKSVKVSSANTGKFVKVRGVKAAIRGTNFKGVF